MQLAAAIPAAAPTRTAPAQGPRMESDLYVLAQAGVVDKALSQFHVLCSVRRAVWRPQFLCVPGVRVPCAYNQRVGTNARVIRQRERQEQRVFHAVAEAGGASKAV